MSIFETSGPIDVDTGRWKGVPAPEVIEEIEAQGQIAFVNSTTLPIKIQLPWHDIGLDTQRLYTQEEAEAEFTKIGIILGDPVDDTFREAKLPEGWKKVPSDHSMWSSIVDDRGEERVLIFFKAAPYDYNAHMFIPSEKK